MKPYNPIILTQKLKYNSHYLPKIYEAVIRTSKYEKLLQKKFKIIESKIPINLDASNIIKLFNEVFKNNYIIFELKDMGSDESQKYSIIKSKTLNNNTQDIIIYVTPYIKKCMEGIFLFILFQDHCFKLLRHELVHRGQFINETKQLLPDRQVLDKVEWKYYSNVYETMAFANMIIETLRFEGFDDEKILKIVNSGKATEEESEFLFFYQTRFRNNRDILNKLYKYIYEYIKGEAKNIL